MLCRICKIFFPRCEDLICPVLQQRTVKCRWGWVMVFNITFNNISVLSVEETRVPGLNHWSAANHWQTLSHNVVLSTWAGFELTALVVIGTDSIGSCKFNNHRITITMAPKVWIALTKKTNLPSNLMYRLSPCSMNSSRGSGWLLLSINRHNLDICCWDDHWRFYVYPSYRIFKINLRNSTLVLCVNMRWCFTWGGSLVQIFEPAHSTEKVQLKLQL